MAAIFPLRRAIERLRAGLFDPVAVERLTMEEDTLIDCFAKDLQALEQGLSRHLCICGSYGQGKSHNLNYLQKNALRQGFATSLVQLDIREIPFHQCSVVYQSLMQNLALPTGESFAEAWKSCAILKALDGMPYRFRMILQAMASPNALPCKELKNKSGLKPKDFDHWLEKALLNHDLPIAQLKHILKARNVDWDRKQPLVCRGNSPYVQMIQSLGALLHAMGHKGLVLLFDEAESIAQGRLSSRVKSYAILHQLFQHNGFVYPVFAFTQAFFDQVRSEEYGGEEPRFPQNYYEDWKNLQIIRLQEFSATHWKSVQDRLINLYARAYQLDLAAQIPEISRHMQHLLSTLHTQETRFKLKALVHQLDIRTTS